MIIDAVDADVSFIPTVSNKVYCYSKKSAYEQNYKVLRFYIYTCIRFQLFEYREEQD